MTGFYKVTVKATNKSELIIMVGYPGSGKSTYVEQVYGSNSNYVILHGDDYKTVPKMMAAAKPHIANGKITP